MPVVPVADALVHYDRFDSTAPGADSRPALVLVHGTGSVGAALTWGQTVPRFADRTVLTPDLSGTERTVDGGGRLTTEGLAAQVIAVIEDAGTGPVDLLGFSMGAPVSATVAALRPDLVRRLILVAGWARTEADEYTRNHFTLWQRLGAVDPEGFGRIVAMTGFSRGYLNTIGREGFEQLVPNMPPTPGTLRHVDLDLRVDIRAMLPRVEAETLVIGCTQDATVPVELSRALHAELARTTTASYAEIDAGHVVFFEKADEFVRRVSDFTAAA
ncbi:alpha/beta fold hydrolase [Streptomyces albireticuli]|uniref:Alpha/beta hydrolase n=1 Tax=Streptomyces albireticuli TaxID=1940 RepID=A0A2A2CX32_9ACTN|nr:alpha/beta hydrolase [Streptomyces albireticuli]MCD9145129.1 alpha/beta hydrolase [Streptomyces albireticuli]MCD9164696.1 alpha/beta hydrolase [Streptomyces albireticuli]MCD9194961.1 alpha/beta hydrolase [Streptomyces albireticuli]PAU44758.1 alpha/beta hydrolase [Streptomyces albireticuli]